MIWAQGEDCLITERIESDAKQPDPLMTTED